MSKALFTFSTRREPGTWKGCVDRSNGHRFASLICPECGQLVPLGTGHLIAEDGIVVPSVVCPTHGCTFHEFIRLDGWKEHRP